MNPAVQSQSASAPNQNLLDMYKANNQGNPNSVNVNSAVQQKPSAPAGPARTYIPSSAGVRIDPNSADSKKDDKVNSLMGKADKAERSANRFIGH